MNSGISLLIIEKISLRTVPKVCNTQVMAHALVKQLVIVSDRI